MTHNMAFVFPGQGSQKMGMLDALYEQYPVIKDVFDEASDYLDYDVWQIAHLGPEDKLNQTIYTQPIMLAADIAIWRLWQQQQGFKPKVMAGHSLGEYAALVAGDTLSFRDALTLVSQRAQLMQDAVPEGEGAMAAIMGLDTQTVTALCDEVNQPEQRIAPANYNSPQQVVVAGEVSGVDALVDKAKHAGARLARKLPMSVPSHCFLLQPAAEAFKPILEDIWFFEPSIPIINNVDAKAYKQPAAIREALYRQLFNPVRWVETVQLMLADYGIEVLAECGPNKVLSGLNRRIANAQTLNLGTPEQFQTALKGELSC